MEKLNISPPEVMESYGDIGAEKCTKSTSSLLLLSILAGALIAFAAAGANTASHTAATLGTAKLISGMLFPFGLGMVILTGAELFTGNCLIAVSVLEKKATFAGMIRNWCLVYLGNFIGSVLVASACAFSGQFDLSKGALALSTMKTALAKCEISFGNGIILGIMCNVLVCLGVICAMTAKTTEGKIMGAFLPVAIFVICGFEHSIANMYYIPAGLFAKSVPSYLALAEEAGLDLAGLTWSNFFLRNLIPVTTGNIIGGAGIGILLLKGHKTK